MNILIYILIIYTINIVGEFIEQKIIRKNEHQKNHN